MANLELGQARAILQLALNDLKASGTSPNSVAALEKLNISRLGMMFENRSTGQKYYLNGAGGKVKFNPNIFPGGYSGI